MVPSTTAHCTKPTNPPSPSPLPPSHPAVTHGPPLSCSPTPHGFSRFTRTPTPGRLYLVFELVERCAHRELQAHPQGLPLRDVKTATWQLCHALRFLHENQVQHACCTICCPPLPLQHA